MLKSNPETVNGNHQHTIHKLTVVASSTETETPRINTAALHNLVSQAADNRGAVLGSWREIATLRDALALAQVEARCAEVIGRNRRRAAKRLRQRIDELERQSAAEFVI